MTPERGRIDMARTGKQWQEELFPELLTIDGGRYRAIVTTLRQLGLRRGEEAEALGYFCIRAVQPIRTGALWVHENDLPKLEQAAAEIAELRESRAAAERRAREERERRIAEALAGFEWLTEADRRAARERLEALPIGAIDASAAERALVPRRLADALDAISGVRARGDEIVVSGELRFDAFGEEVTHPSADLTSIALDGELRELLLAGDLDRLRAALEPRIAHSRAEAISRLRVAVYEAIADAARRIDETIALLEMDEEEAARARDALVAHAVARLAQPGAKALARLERGLSEMAEDLVWARRRELLKASRDEREVRWSLGGDRKNPVLAYWLSARLYALDESFRASIDRKVPMPRDLRDALLGQPLDVFVAIADAFVAELVDEEQSEIDRALGSLESRIERAAATPGFERRALAGAIRAEFAARRFAVDSLVSRTRTQIDRLVKQAKETEAVQHLLTRANFARYADFFTAARALSRELILYVGPTNSGKTYHALNHLAEGESGVYLAPLRLLALEGQEEMEKRGRPTSFLTGEERDLKPGSRFTSSTIEMLDFERVVDAAVVDEVQLLADEDRGWAWSAAIIGAPAKKVIMTGSPDAVPLVEELARYLNEPLTIHELSRFTPLRVHDDVDDLDDIEPGTAIVCFSRRDVLGLKQYLENKHRVSVIYGNLSPQVRREEAMRFRKGETKVLVATDAIALGLNLPIKTVIFYTTWKWNGKNDVRLTHSEVRQIGGRAGRFGKHDAGFVGTLSHNDLDYVREAFESPIEPIEIRAHVRPSLQHASTMGEVIGSRGLTRLLDLFRRRIRFDASHLVASVPDDMLELATLADEAGMKLEEKFVFACAPVDVRNAYMMRTYSQWMSLFASNRVSRLDRLPTRYEHTTGEADPEAFYHAEVQVKMLTVYAWLAYRYPSLFPDLDECDRQRDVLNRYIERTLRKRGRMRRCSNCGASLPALSQYKLCDNCFRSRRRR
jgi:ATP-dependent RNA helicase SUPV3L1/SUV3